MADGTNLGRFLVRRRINLLARKESNLTTDSTSDFQLFRDSLARFGYALVSLSVLAAVALWHWTCVDGGYHCFAGGTGAVMKYAQIGAMVGLICSLFGRREKRLLFVLVATIDLIACYFQLLVH